MVITKFKSKAKFGRMVNFFAKLNFSVLDIRDRRGRTNDKWSNYKLKKLSFHNYGNLLQVSIRSPNGSTIDIIKGDVRNRRGGKIMLFKTHESHNKMLWDFEAHHIRVCNFESYFLQGFKQESRQRNFESDKVLMRIYEEERPDSGGIEMGGDLNRFLANEN